MAPKRKPPAYPILKFVGGPADGKVGRYAPEVPDEIRLDLGRALYRKTGPGIYEFSHMVENPKPKPPTPKPKPMPMPPEPKERPAPAKTAPPPSKLAQPKPSPPPPPPPPAETVSALSLF